MSKAAETGSARHFLLALGLLILPALLLSIIAAAKGLVIAHEGRPAYWNGRAAGEQDVLGPLTLGITLLRRNNIADYQLNFSGFGEYRDLWEQRTIEGAWPIRYVPTSHHILSRGPIERAECRLIDQAQGLVLYVCS